MNPVINNMNHQLNTFNGDSVFITERPIQIINAIELIDQLNLNGRVDLFIANTFHDAKGVSERLKISFPHINVFLFCDYQSAISHVPKRNYSHLFLHWDVGFRTQRILRHIKRLNPRLSISVFEEGVGTYRSDIYHFAKRKIFQLLNYPINVGGSIYTDRIFVHNVYEYNKNSVSTPKIVAKINRSVSESISYRWNNYIAIFDSDRFIENIEYDIDIECSIYMSGWNYNPRIPEKYFRDDHLNIIKLHPHCSYSEDFRKYRSVPANIPAELLIQHASHRCKIVNVIHHGSSSTRYINAPNIRFFKAETS